MKTKNKTNDDKGTGAGKSESVFSPLEHAEAMAWLRCKAVACDIDISGSAIVGCVVEVGGRKAGAGLAVVPDRARAVAAMREAARLVRWAALVGLTIDPAPSGGLVGGRVAVSNPERQAIEAERARVRDIKLSLVTAKASLSP